MIVLKNLRNHNALKTVIIASRFLNKSVENIPQKTVAEVTETFSKMVASAEPYKNLDKALLMNILPKKQEELPPRSMQDSWDFAMIPLSTDKKLREKYVTFLGGVRVGRLLEDLDVFAGYICLKYIKNPLQTADLPSPYTIVTGMVDRLDFEQGILSLKGDCDMMLEGHVSWVGKSSMEIMISIQQLNEGKWETVTSSIFIMVARDPLHRSSAVVNPLICETAEERRIFRQGETRKLARKLTETKSLFNAPPNTTEKHLVHEVFMQMANQENLSFAPKKKPENSKWMADTKLKNVIICHPEHRNRSSKIFGGFLMRQAFELSWTCAFVYSKRKPVILHIDDILFRRPVELGCLLYFNSQVIYTEGKRMQVSTKANIFDPVKESSILSNIFQLTFEVDAPVSPVLPRTYDEAMMYLDGRRHYQLVTGERAFYSQGETPKDMPT